MNKLVLFQIFVFCICNLHSQTYVIKGNIKNSNGNPIEFSTIQLLFDSVYHQSTLSDSLGNYYLKATKKGDCELVTNFLGYYPDRKKFTFNKDTTINFVLQADSIFLKEVTIVGTKKLIEVKSDRYVINIGGNIETKGRETTDILKQLPTMNISELSMNMSGKSSIIVYINDHIVRLDGQSLLSYLNSIPTDNINSIEIISTPPSQYDAAGSVGIIKIVTKKNIRPGWKEYIKAGFIKNSYSSYMISAFANYTGKKMFLDASINNGNFSYLNQSNYYCYFPYETTTTFNPKKWNSIGSEAQASLGYDFNQNSNFIVNFQIPLNNKETIADIKNQTSFVNPINEHTDSIIFSNGKTIKNNYTYNSEVFFKHLFPNKQSYFTSSIAYLNNYTFNRRSFSSFTQIDNTNTTTDNFYSKGSLKYNILTPKLDFTFPLFSCTVNTGLKLSFIETSSNSELFNTINNNNIMDSTQSNKFNYTEKVQSVYYSMEKNTKKWSFKAGIRSELTKTIGNSLILDEQHKDSYIDFFPTVYISRVLNNKSNVSFTYAYRIERPPYQYLDPFRWYVTKYDYALGNPFLKPSYINNFELTYLLNNTFTTKVYFTDQDNKIGRFVVLDSLNILNQIQKTDNFLNVKIYGINIYKLLKWYDWQETVLQGNFAYSEYLSNKNEFSNISGISGTIIMNNTFFINKKIQTICNIEEGLPGINNYRSMKNFFKFDFGFNYMFNKTGFEARLFVSDIFKTANPEYFYISDGIKQIYHNYLDTRMLRIVLIWKLGNWYNKTSNISSPSNIDEKQRL
jgi:hypothetical protein